MTKEIQQKLYWIFLISFFFGLLHCDSRKNNRLVIARVEDSIVSLAEFRERLNNILLHTTQDNAALHEALFQNLIDEKVLIYEAKKRGYNQTDDYQYEKKRIELDILLDTYREQVAQKRIKVTEKDIEQAFTLSHEQVRARILYASDEEKATLYYRQLMNGATFEELALDAFQDPRLSQSGGDMGYFSWDDMDLPFSDAAQQLKIGEISKPIMTRNGWYIIKVEDRFQPPLSENDYHKEHKKLKWRVTHRKKVRAIHDYTKGLLDDLDMTFNESILHALMQEVSLNSSADGEFFSDYGLNDDDVIATVAGKPWTLNTFYEKAQWTSSRQRRSVKDIEGLKRFIEGLAVRDVLVKKAYEKDIHNDKEMQKKLNKQLDLYLINKMNSEIMDTVRVSENEARNYFEQFRDQFVFPGLANVREILVDTEDKAYELLKSVKAGEDFAELARKYSLRKWSAKRSGELGYGTKAQYGIHGKKIFEMMRGEIGGPFKTEGYYSIIQVIDFRSSQPKNFEQARPEIENFLLEEKKRDILLKTINKMRKNLHIEYNMNGLT